jgi:hypothetical protein
MRVALLFQLIIDGELLLEICRTMHHLCVWMNSTDAGAFISPQQDDNESSTAQACNVPNMLNDIGFLDILSRFIAEKMLSECLK